MKSLFQYGFAVALAMLMGFVPANAVALNNISNAHTRTQTYHDRTPTVHTHGSHPRRA